MSLERLNRTIAYLSLVVSISFGDLMSLELAAKSRKPLELETEFQSPLEI